MDVALVFPQECGNIALLERQLMEPPTVTLGSSKQKRIVIVGGHDLACLCLDYLVSNSYKVVLCIGRRDDEGQDSIFPSLLHRAQKHGIPSIRPENINSPETLGVVEDARADVVLSIHNNQIFRGGWFDLFEGKPGIVNSHYAPLPRYAGYWPELWAIWNDEKDFAVTIHYIDRGVDTGNIIAQYPVVISDDDTRKTLHDRCTQVSFKMITDRLDVILDGRVEGQPQDLSKRTYCKRELPNDGFVDWGWEPQRIRRFYRALSFPPFAGPKIRIGDRVISSVDGDLEFFKPVFLEQGKY